MENNLLTRSVIEERENEFLAPYAMKSKDCTGRSHKEEGHPYRSVYQRDKDRIIYSTAFRRLEYKTQVFVNHEGDYYRTRLTHTLEVAQIARTLARALMLNEDLVEAIALAHDLGHTPFGHAGEDTLSGLMADYGGFDHNTHGLRVADLLEDRYPDFPGLNLTNEVRRGIIRHSTPFDLSRMGGTDVPGPWLLEIQTVDLADEIAYDNHDIDDGLKSGLLKESDLRGISLWDDAIVGVRPSSRSSTSDDSVRRNQIIRALINVQVSDVIKNTFEVIKKRGINSIEDVAKQKERTISFSPSMEENRKPLRGVLMNRLYRHYRVVRMSSKASRFLQRLFELYCDTPEQLPPQAQMSIKSVGKHRAICDYLAGMTDRYALDQYKAFFEPYERV